MFNTNCFWRETQRPARLMIFDARLMIFVAIFVMHIKLWTFTVLVIAIALFWFLERKGLSMPNAFRRMRALAVGAYRAARPYRAERRRVDYEFEAETYAAKYAAMQRMEKPKGRNPLAKKTGVLAKIGLA